MSTMFQTLTSPIWSIEKSTMGEPIKYYSSTDTSGIELQAAVYIPESKYTYKTDAITLDYEIQLHIYDDNTLDVLVAEDRVEWNGDIFLVSDILSRSGGIIILKARYNQYLEHE